MKHKNKRPPFAAVAKRKTLQWYSKPFLGFRNELIAIKKNTSEIVEQNDEMINLLHCILAQLIQLNVRLA